MLRKINIRLLHHFGNTISLQQTQLLIILLIRSQNTLYIHVAQRTVNKKNKHIYIFLYDQEDATGNSYLRSFELE